MPTINKSTPRPWIVPPKEGDRRNQEHDKFYDTGVWRRTRKDVLKKEPLCRYCHKEGRITPATVVDHIVPIKQGGDKLRMGNLQPLCEGCHNEKSRNEGQQAKAKQRR